MLGCDAEAGPAVEFRSAPEGALYATDGDAQSKLGYVPADGEDPYAMANGGRVPLGEDRIAEVFLSPYPPDWNTDLHLYLLDKDTFEPLTNVDVDLEYDMVWMNHGIDPRSGTKVGEGHYLLPLSFLMYGDWNVDIRLAFRDEAASDLQVIVKFDP
jgi:hypothetical protein